MSTRISLQEARELFPQWLDRPLVGGPIVVEDRGQPQLVVLDGKEYTRYAAWRRRDAVRAFVFNEMDRRQAEAWWNEGFDALDKLRDRAQDVTPLELESLIDEAVRGARAGRQES